MTKLSLRDLDLKNKKALVRVDFNVPIENGRITDDTRIRSSLPTIQYILDHGGSVILMSHLGRPKGKPDPKYSLALCAKHLAQLLKRPVDMAADCIGPKVQSRIKELKPGKILMLENLRFHPAEENPEKDASFAGELAKFGDVYINDAFGAAHRAHSSITTIAQFFPGKAAMGFLMEKEMDYLGNHLRHPKRPFYAILGGAKISTKFKVIDILMNQADLLLIGGAMAYTFFKAKKITIGDSLVENDFLEAASRFMDNRANSKCRLLLPIDLVVAREPNAEAERMIVQVKDGIPKGFQGVDIGPQTIQLYINELQNARTIFWNGPLGIFECPPFDKGTNAIAKAIANLPDAISIVGGGDSVAAIEHLGVTDKISHISTGGGAALEYIELSSLPGIEALTDVISK